MTFIKIWLNLAQCFFVTENLDWCKCSISNINSYSLLLHIFRLWTSISRGVNIMTRVVKLLYYSRTLVLHSWSSCCLRYIDMIHFPQGCLVFHEERTMQFEHSRLPYCSYLIVNDHIPVIRYMYVPTVWIECLTELFLWFLSRIKYKALTTVSYL